MLNSPDYREYAPLGDRGLHMRMTQNSFAVQFTAASTECKKALSIHYFQAFLFLYIFLIVMTV